MSRRFSVVVPASTSNLGPGFDALGLALELFLRVEVECSEGRDEIVVENELEGKDLPKGADNLLAKAAMSVLGGRPVGRLVLRCRSEIPLARGLGSSAAAVVAGLLAANELVENKLTAGQLLEYAAALEGHPDNVAPLLNPGGGLVACLRARSALEFLPLDVHPDLRAAVCIPDFPLETKKARAVLPPTYLRDVAVHNIARAAVLTEALARGRWERLARAMEDELHQPYRVKLVPGLPQVVAAADAVGGVGAALSGSGPTVVALGPKAAVEKAGPAMAEAFAKAGVKARSLVLGIARKGAYVEASR